MSVLTQRTIVVIEDDVLSRRLLVDLLTVHQYVVRAFSNAEEALAVVHEDNTTLILMDIRLPGMNGFVALEQLRDSIETRSIPVIAVTASVMLGEQQKILRSGFNDYHAKPIQIAELLRQIERLLVANSGGNA